MKRLQSGISLVEMMVALALLVILGSLFYPLMGSMAQFSAKQKTAAELREIQQGLTQLYRRYAWDIDSAAGASATELQFGPSKAYALATCDAACSSSLISSIGKATGGFPQTGFAALAQELGTSDADAALDGFGRPWQVYVSQPLTQTWQGHTLRYRVIGIASNLNNGSNAVNWDPSTGELSVPAGSRAKIAIVNGFTVQRDLLEETLERLEDLVDTYANYYQQRFLTSPSRDMTVDYFASFGANSSWDAGNPITATNGSTYTEPGGSGVCTDSSPLTSHGFVSTLGLSDLQIRDGWGNEFGFGVGPDSKCTPAGGTPTAVNRNPGSGHSPPYTAWLMTWLPTGEPLMASAVGRY